MLTGLLIAFYAYIRNTALPGGVRRPVRRALPLPVTNGISTSSTTCCSSARRSGSAACFWKRGDEGTIDRFGPDGAAAAVVAGNRLTARIQSGYLYTYALVMLLGVAAATTWAMAR